MVTVFIYDLPNNHLDSNLITPPRIAARLFPGPLCINLKYILTDLAYLHTTLWDWATEDESDEILVEGSFT